MKQFNSNIKQTIAIENTMRCFEDGLHRSVFFNIEWFFKVDFAMNERFSYELYFATDDKEISFGGKTLYFKDKCVIFDDEHEDPTIFMEDYCGLSVAIERKIIKEILGRNNVEPSDVKYARTKISKLNKDIYEVILDETIENIPWDSINNDSLFTSYNGYNFKCSEDAFLTFHLSDSDGIYEEKTSTYVKDTIVNIEEYLDKYVYVGIQFSIENNDLEVEVEEKYIVKGQKGIFESNYFKKNGITYFPNLVFNPIYLKNIKKEKMIEINSAKELFFKYKKGIIPIKVFESNIGFLEDTYREKITFGQNRVFSTNPKKKVFHIDSIMCKGCSLNYACIQNIPSNLSNEVFKLNLLKENHEDCDLYQLLKKEKENRLKS